MVTGPLLPFSSPPRRTWIVRRVIGVVVVGVLAGAAAVLQIRGWGSLTSEFHGPRGQMHSTVASVVAAVLTVILVVRTLLRRPRWLALVTVAALVVGGFAGEQIYLWLHGTNLGERWTAPYDGSDSLVSEGFWTDGSAVIRTRADQVVSYDAATGHANCRQFGVTSGAVSRVTGRHATMDA